jgi:hypothetical protein
MLQLQQRLQLLPRLPHLALQQPPLLLPPPPLQPQLLQLSLPPPWRSAQGFIPALAQWRQRQPLPQPPAQQQPAQQQPAQQQPLLQQQFLPPLQPYRPPCALAPTPSSLPLLHAPPPPFPAQPPSPAPCPPTLPCSAWRALVLRRALWGPLAAPRGALVQRLPAPPRCPHFVFTSSAVRSSSRARSPPALPGVYFSPPWGWMPCCRPPMARCTWRGAAGTAPPPLSVPMPPFPPFPMTSLPPQI